MKKNLKKWKTLLAVSCFIIVVSAGSAFAEMSEQELRLKALEEKIEKNSQDIDLAGKLKFKGDFRLRHETNFRDAPTPDQNRERIRFRLGGGIDLYKDLDLGFQIATGSADPISHNQTLGNTFEKKGFQLDKAYVHYKYESADFTGGKMGIPFMRSEVVWDDDVSMEGLSEQFVHKISDSTKLFVNLGQFVIDEVSSSSKDPYMTAWQGGIEQKIGNVKARIGVAYYDYINVKGTAIDHLTSGNTKTSSKLDNDYNILDILGELHFDLGKPVTLLGEYVKNTGANSGNNEDTAFQAGIKIGDKLAQLGDWKFRYYYREVEADAVLDALSDSDFHGSGTNSKGSEIGVNFGLRKGVQFDVTYFDTKVKQGAKNNYDRLQADLVFKF